MEESIDRNVKVCSLFNFPLFVPYRHGTGRYQRHIERDTYSNLREGALSQELEVKQQWVGRAKALSESLTFRGTRGIHFRL